MAKITIKELYYGDKYAVMGEVFKTMFLAFPNKASVDEQTALELEFVRQRCIELFLVPRHELEQFFQLLISPRALLERRYVAVP